jgi:hypothetical protein
MTSGELRTALLNGEITFAEVAEALTGAMEHYADSRAEIATHKMWIDLAQDESYELRQCGLWDADIQTIREMAKGWVGTYANECDAELKAIQPEEEE